MKRPLTILLVDDNIHDVTITRKCLQKAGVQAETIHLENGQECMAYLRQQEPYREAVRPDLVLLDINMPIMTGREVMREISLDDQLRHLPVLILTTSAASEDVSHMYQHRCSSYLVKPADFQEFVALIRDVMNYWSKLAKLPPKDSEPEENGLPSLSV
ncbi:MAG: response regulator [Verrucomicrobiota bacterium]